MKEDVQNELEALKAIYCDDFVEFPSVWNQPCFIIKVKPTGSEVYATANCKLINNNLRIIIFELYFLIVFTFILNQCCLHSMLHILKQFQR
jgi:uncharacterized protein YcsI (UPF0317 family)